MHIVPWKMEPKSGGSRLSQPLATIVQNTGWMMWIITDMLQFIRQMLGRQSGGLISNLPFLSVVEVNAVNSWARARGVEGDVGWDFQRNLATQMLENNLDQDLIHRSPIRARNTRTRASITAGEGIHAIMNHPYFTSKWLRSSWKKAKDKYHKTPCACGNHWTHCICDKGKAMCVECFNIHILNV